MRSWLIVALLGGLAAGCTLTPREPDRTVFGVSGDRAAGASGEAADAEMRKFLDAKLNQICTGGYEFVKVDTQPAEGGRQLVDEEARCKDYRVSFF
jgi:hypothetical protein